MKPTVKPSQLARHIEYPKHPGCRCDSAQPTVLKNKQFIFFKTDGFQPVILQPGVSRGGIHPAAAGKGKAKPVPADGHIFISSPLFPPPPLHQPILHHPRSSWRHPQESSTSQTAAPVGKENRKGKTPQCRMWFSQGLH